MAPGSPPTAKSDQEPPANTPSPAAPATSPIATAIGAGIGGVVAAATGAQAIIAVPSGWAAVKAGVVLALNLWNALERLGQVAKERELGNWLEDLDKATTELDHAKTMEERINAAKKLADLTRRLR